MTTLWVQPLAVTCAACGHCYVFPVDYDCPACGQALYVKAHPGAVLGNAPPPSPETNTDEVDGTARQILLVGIVLCATLMILGIWGEGLLQGLADSAGLPPAVFRVVRLGLVIVAAGGFLRGCMSLLGWRSGPYFYRRFRRW